MGERVTTQDHRGRFSARRVGGAEVPFGPTVVDLGREFATPQRKQLRYAQGREGAQASRGIPTETQQVARARILAEAAFKATPREIEATERELRRR
jgi:hypothetical protein